MKTYSTKDIRNVVLIGSTRSGKTTLSEAMLYEGKVIDRRGSVEGKNTVSDNSEIEQINQRSIYATPLYAEFMDTKFNIIDAPGADDFVGGAISAFRVCDTAILVANAQQGVEVGTEIFARYADKYNMPVILAVNVLIFVLMSLGVYRNAETAVITKSTAWFQGFNQFEPDFLRMLYESLLGCFVRGSNDYNGVLWTIPYLFWGALVVYLAAFLVLKVIRLMCFGS